MRDLDDLHHSHLGSPNFVMQHLSYKPDNQSAQAFVAGRICSIQSHHHVLQPSYKWMGSGL